MYICNYVSISNCIIKELQKLLKPLEKIPKLLQDDMLKNE